MPKKHPISRLPTRRNPFGKSPVEDMNGHLTDVAGCICRLGYAFEKYYRKTDSLRAKFFALEMLFDDFAKTARLEMAEEAKRNDS
ncbi:MAG: hypothetical protein ABIZ04_21165 [Opitutus sp.]